VARTHMADNALVEGAICDTMDLRRSVILSMYYSMDGKVLRNVPEMHERC
jgi:hypothetical protein